MSIRHITVSEGGVTLSLSVDWDKADGRWGYSLAGVVEELYIAAGLVPPTFDDDDEEPAGRTRGSSIEEGLAPLDETGTKVTDKGNISDSPEDRQDPDEDTRTPAQKAKDTRAKNKAAKEAAKLEEQSNAEAAAAAASGDPHPEEDDIDIMGDDDADDAIDIDTTVTEAPPVEEFDEITDGELSAAINAKVQLLRAQAHPDYVAVVKAAIQAFANGEENFTAGSMGQATRRKFLTKLKAIKGPKKEAA